MFGVDGLPGCHVWMVADVGEGVSAESFDAVHGDLEAVGYPVDG